MQTLLKLAKKAWLASVSEVERPALEAQLRGVGFHSEKRVRVQDPEFREMSPKAQEALSGTKCSTLHDTYDRIGVNEIRAEAEAAKKRAIAST